LTIILREKVGNRSLKSRERESRERKKKLTSGIVNFEPRSTGD